MTVSVIVTAYNCLQYIDQCLSSVLAQTFEHIEIIVIDDCSDDGTWDHLNKRYGKSPKVSLYQTPCNSGPSFARNMGIRLSSGDFITTLDGDDFMDCRKVENEIALSKKFLGRHLVTSIHFLTQSDGNNAKAAFSRRTARNGRIFDYALFRITSFGRDWLIPRDALNDVGFFDESTRLYEDWELKLRLLKKYSLHHTLKPGTYYRQLPGGLSKRPPVAHERALVSIFKRHSEYGLIGSYAFKILSKQKSWAKVLKRLLHVRPIGSSFIMILRQTL